ncbi:hypothetical protein [Psychrobacillus sp. NEAU-3TGS]|uniref:hypothetical protein n=1 Tax=Psychrobacillus sp. NEAU-3TGS TaxID=2995412 RepID=UPI00249CC414|nr:hypothetical protein [Psychrobacillus sp. NEAU-3TGS]
MEILADSGRNLDAFLFPDITINWTDERFYVSEMASQVSSSRFKKFLSSVAKDYEKRCQ